jgi:hypothetical protein
VIGVAVGCVLVLLLIAAVVVASRTGAPSPGVAADRPAPTRGIGGADVESTGVSSAGGIEIDSAVVASPDGLELSGLRAVSRRDPEPPVVGDTVTVSYVLRNTTSVS